MSHAIFNRMLLLVHGQGDELATPRGCSGDCNQGRTTCDCEFSHDVPPDASRTIRPAPLAAGARARINRTAAVIAVTAFSVLAALLELFGAAPFNKEF